MPDTTAKKPTDERSSRRESAADMLGERAARYRKERGLKVTEVARAIGVSPSLISQIERGQSQPSVSTLFGLAEALEVPVDAFFTADATRERSQPGAADGVPTIDPVPRAAREADAGEAARPAGDRYMVRRGDRAAIDIEGGVRWERLTPATLPHVEFLELVYAPGAESHSELYRHPGTEMVLVLAGRLHIVLGFETYELETGDSIHFPSTMPHRYLNPSDSEETRAVTVILHDDDGSSIEDPPQQQRRP